MELVKYFKQKNASTFEDECDGYIEPIYTKEYMLKLNYKKLLKYEKTIKNYQNLYSRYTKQYNVAELQSYIKLDISLTRLTHEFTNDDTYEDKPAKKKQLITSELIANQQLKAEQLHLYIINTNINIDITIKEYHIYYKHILILKKCQSIIIASYKSKNTKQLYYERNKEKRSKYITNYISNAVHITCECGLKMNPYKKAQHKRTKKHIAAMYALDDADIDD